MPNDGSLRITPRPVRRQVEDRLREAIVSGRFMPGDHLSDRMLCDLFGVSRSVIREAVRLLEAEGLVDVVPNRGPFVSFLSPAEATQIYEVRAVLEALAGRGFAERASDAEISELRGVFEELAAAGPAADRVALLGLKRRFYEVLLRGCRNAYVARMLDQVLNRNSQLRATTLSDPERLPHTIAEMRRIVEAIERRDHEGTWEACRDHVMQAARVALRILNQQAREQAEASRARASAAE
ncbi:GntR family transcriptional regulator [Roseomonas sp. SSH11]|uniref:GntR family transcriptional regulator n=1 Tax=Pararoseomonas baculiformis TaxID=2820812 RepID=A0ABS4AKG3_9PROT|nr:GntR family transcriptional regulator [Pararoseomonas baculiformis]MBP0446978.1 GntR family transcriptional regulator [Pararoseomonas baculiformis]